jgi:CRP-like cAMP-binding protein
MDEIAIEAVWPSSMLPPVLGTLGYAAVAVRRATDRAPSTPPPANTSMRPLPRLHLTLGRGAHFAWAQYAFVDATLSPLTVDHESCPPLAEQTLTIGYSHVRWRYQPLDAHGILTGDPVQGGGTPTSARPTLRSRRLRSMFDHRTEEGHEERGFLTDLHEDEVATIVAHAQRRRYQAGEAAISRGDTDRSVFIVTSGRFRVVGPQAPTAVLTAGDIFGELGFFDCRPRRADVVAVESSEALMMTRAGLDRLRLHQPRLGHIFVMDLARVVCQRLRERQPSLARSVP